MGASQGRDVNSLQSHKLSCVDSVNLVPTSSYQNTAPVNCLEKLEILLVISIKYASWVNKKVNSLTSQLNSEFVDDGDNDNDDDDEDSQF